MLRRPALAAIALLLPVALLAGCSAETSTAAERSAWKQWADETVVAANGAAGVGGLAGTAGAPLSGTLAMPAETPVTSLQLACHDTDLVSFELRYTSGSRTATGSHDLVCRSGSTRIALPAGVTGLTGLTVTASSADGRGAWVAVLRDDG